MKSSFVSNPGGRRGFSLIELLVVVGIIGVLLSMMLPAVQKVREAAKGLQCINNLHQIGIAYYTYHSHNSSSPNGGTFSWAGSLCKYLEQMNINSMGDPRPIFLCPTRIGASEQRIDYTFSRGRPAMNVASINEIVDGTSNTILLAERASIVVNTTWTNRTKGDIIDYWRLMNDRLGQQWPDNPRDPYNDSAQIDTRSYVTYTYSVDPSGYYDASAVGTAKQFEVWNDSSVKWTIPHYVVSYYLGFGGSHVGSMTMLMCDGSARRFRYGSTGLTALFDYADGAGTLPE